MSTVGFEAIEETKDRGGAEGAKVNKGRRTQPLPNLEASDHPYSQTPLGAPCVGGGGSHVR
jgi:hypothetical protein